MTREDLDITSATAVSSAVERLKPDLVVNCAAWTAVDDAETHEDAALAVNGHGPGHLAAACRDLDAILVQISTDYVFDGTAREPYPEDAEPSAAYRLRADQAGRPGRRARDTPPQQLHRLHRLAVRRARPQLRPHHDQAGSRRDQPGGGRRPAWPAHLDS